MRSRRRRAHALNALDSPNEESDIASHRRPSQQMGIPSEMQGDQKGSGEARPMREKEVYALECFRCHKEVEVSVKGPFYCPICKEKLEIKWRK